MSPEHGREAASGQPVMAAFPKAFAGVIRQNES
jgi:hypothetical protein